MNSLTQLRCVIYPVTQLPGVEPSASRLHTLTLETHTHTYTHTHITHTHTITQTHGYTPCTPFSMSPAPYERAGLEPLKLVCWKTRAQDLSAAHTSPRTKTDPRMRTRGACIGTEAIIQIFPCVGSERMTQVSIFRASAAVVSCSSATPAEAAAPPFPPCQGAHHCLYPRAGMRDCLHRPPTADTPTLLVAAAQA